MLPGSAPDPNNLIPMPACEDLLVSGPETLVKTPSEFVAGPGIFSQCATAPWNLSSVLV